jgi:hypothetical protein
LNHLLLRLISTLLKLEISTLLKTITNSCFQGLKFQALEGLKFQALEGLKFQDKQTQKQMIRPYIVDFFEHLKTITIVAEFGVLKFALLNFTYLYQQPALIKEP